MSLLTRTNDFRNVDPAPEELQVLHHTFGVVLAQSNTKLGEHTLWAISTGSSFSDVASGVVLPCARVPDQAQPQEGK